MAPCERLPWDSEFFGIDIARMTVSTFNVEGWERIGACLEVEHLDCLYVLVSSADAESVRAAEEAGLRLVDIRVTLGRDLDGTNRPVKSEVATYPPNDLDELAAIARVSHRDSRFYHDPGFSTDQCDAFYDAWIRNSSAGYADKVLVSRADGNATGYVTCHRSGGVGRIGLIAVAQAAQGHGVGGDLVNASLAWFEENGCHRVTVATQGRNSRAIKLYERLGFVTESVEHWFHYWPAADESP